MAFHLCSQKARTEFVEICAAAGSTTVAQENAALSIGREYLPECAIKVLDKIKLSKHEECDYYEWLIKSVQSTINESDTELEWH